MCKKTSPTFWSTDKFDTLSNSWGFTFERVGLEPEWLYRGVARFFAYDTTGERPTVGQILAAARKEHQIYMDSPEGQARAAELRRQREDEREQQLRDGTWRPIEQN